MGKNQSASFQLKGVFGQDDRDIYQHNSQLGLIGSPGKLLWRCVRAVALAVDRNAGSLVEACAVVD